MKSNLFKSIVGTSLALALAAGIFTPSLSAGADGLKGAEKLAGVKAAPVAEAAAPAMSCPMCKSEFSEVTKTEKGHIVTAALAEKHLCGGCATTIGVTGVGKAKKDVAIHTCGEIAKAKTCCTM